MESREDKAGVTLVEILIAIGVLSVLVSLVLAGATRLHNQGNERLPDGDADAVGGVEQRAVFSGDLREGQPVSAAK
ncbi:MAG: prepilin-type N-terminal cleavage/methylation domain-containing protein [Planctomycetota bacterium]|jgi:prepilin-type N-terminal cleavage/methylation domain-containing protein